jgi:RNA polymerase sigma-70 factor, ECF subfamily
MGFLPRQGALLSFEQSPVLRALTPRDTHLRIAPFSPDTAAGASAQFAGDCATLTSILSSTNEETALLERLKDGEPGAVAEVYDQHQGVVHAFARRLVGDAAAAQDLVHEVFVTLPSAMRRFEGGSSLRTFLLSIAVNHARHHLRSASRRRQAMERFAEEPRPSFGGPEQQALRADLARELSRALDLLPLDQRVAFVLCEVEERTSKEAAQIVDAPEATVRTRLFHAKKKLREELERRGLR